MILFEYKGVRITGQSRDEVALLVVGVVPRTREELLDPAYERLLEAVDRADALDHGERIGMLFDTRVEDVDDRTEVRRELGAGSPQVGLVLGAEADVALHLVE